MPMIAMENATTLFSLESWPKVGPTVRFSITSILTGKEPLRSKIARCSASSMLREPEICALPPVIASCTTGLVSTSPSSRMEIGRPILRAVKSANLAPPSSVNSSPTTAWLPLPVIWARASRKSLPVKTVVPLMSLNSSIAVRPSMLMAWSGSLMPGSSTIMRSLP